MAKAIRRNDSVKLLGVTRRNRPSLMMSTALQATVIVVVSFPALAAGPAPNAQPLNGAVTSGTGTLTYQPNLTTLNQSSQKAIVTWPNMDVGSQSTYLMNVPTSTSSTLNKVVSPNPSQIAGKIVSNGQVIIENQSGVIFYEGAQVNTTGLMVTAVGISNANYLAGKMVLDQGGNPNAQVINQGTITIKGAGLAALVAPAVRNAGTINAKMGNVVLAGAQAVTLDMYGDGLVSVNVTKQVTQTPDGVTSLVTNDGVIRAAGGTVQLTAAAADGVVQNLVSAGGNISANTAGGKTGTISINGIGGSVEVTGQLSAQGFAAGTTGGSVAVNATGNVALASTARVNASGKAGGGTVAIGTTLARAQGGPSVTATQTAKSVSIASGATMKADATDTGNGGQITVLSTDNTNVAGNLSAKGGPNGGNGGIVEVSGYGAYSLSGVIDVSAPKGSLGSILIDPTELDITAAVGTEDGTFAGSITAATDPGTQSLKASILNSFVGNVTLQATATIDVQSSFSLGSGSLTMEAGSLIKIDAGVSAGASGSIVLATGGAGPGTPPAAGANPTVNILGTLMSSSGSISLLSGAGGTVSIGGSGTVQAASAAMVTIQTDAFSIAAGGTVTGGTFELAPNTASTAIKLGSGGYLVDYTGIGSTNVRIGAVTVGGVLQAPTASSINISNNFGSSTVALDLEASGAITQSPSKILTASTLSGSAASVVLSGASIAAIGSFAVSGASGFSLDNGGLTGNLTVSGPLTAAAGPISLTNATTITVSGSIGASTGLTLAALTGGITLGTGHILSGATVDLSATGGVTQVSTGTITANTLQSTSGVTGTVNLAGTKNAIGAIQGFTVTTGDFALVSTGSLSAAGTIVARNISVNAGTLGIGGFLNAGTAIALGASAGGITESGKMTAGTLVSIGTIAGGATLTGTNTIATVGSFAVSGGGFTLTDTGSLSVAGLVSGPNISLNAGTLDIAGTVNGGTVAALGAAAGGVSESTGTVIAATLASAGTIAGGMTLGGASNTIGSLGSITLGSGNLTIASTGSLNVAGTVGAANISLNAGTIGIAGFLNGGTTVALGASAGGITESGKMTAGTLVSIGTIAGGATLTGTNTIATIGTLLFAGALNLKNTIAPTISGIVGGGTATATSGTFGVPSLTIGSGGVLNVGSITIATSAGGVTETGTGQIIASSISIATAGTGDVSLTNKNNQIVASNGIQVGSGNLILVDDPTLTLTGAFTANNLFFQVTQAGDTIALGAGGTAATLTAASSGRISIVADNLTEDAGTKITATGGTVEIAPFSTTVAMVLAGSTQLLVDTTLLGNISTGTLTIGQYTDVTNSNSLTTTAANISLDGAVNLTSVAGTLNLQTLGSITEPTGPLTVTTLTGKAVNGATLAIATNNIGTLTGFSASGLTIVNGGALVLAGQDTVGGSGTADISTTSGAVTQGAGGTLIAGTLTSTGSIFGGASFLGTANQIGTITGMTTGGTLAVVDSNALTLAGLVSATNTGTVDITTSAGGVTQANTGTLIAGILTSTGSIFGGASFLGTANQIGTITGMTTGGTLTVVDNMGLTLANQVSAGTTGTVDITTSIGGITQATSGVLTAGTLTSTGNVAGTVNLAGTANQIASVSTLVVVSGNLTLNDAINLNINANGKLSAHQITVTDVGKVISVANGAQFVTDGIARPTGTIAAANLPTSTSNTNGGAYFTAGSFTQTGVLTASNLSGPANILRIDTTGTTAFGSGSGLNGPKTWLILGLTNGATAIGAINVKALDVTYSGTIGGASLFGSINGLTGQGAAGVGNIEPSANANFKMNACAIHSVNCVLMPSQGIPQINPTSEILFAVPYIPSTDDNQDIVVPLVSDTNDTISIDNDDSTDDQSNRDGKRRRPVGRDLLHPIGFETKASP